MSRLRNSMSQLERVNQQLFKKAQVAFERKEDEKACQALMEVLKKDPDNLAALKTLGAIRAAMDQHQAASTYFAKVVLAEPTHANNFYNFGASLHKIGQLDEALACYDEALRLKPDYAEAMSNKGAIYRDKNEFENALACYQAVIEMNKYKFDDYLNYALILSDLNYNLEALEVCDIALTLGALEYHGHFQKGYILAKLMQNDAAKACYHKALELKPNLPEALWNLSHIHLRQGEYAKGWELFESRWDTKNTKLTARNYPQPKWSGNFSIADKTILLHTEQGLGDTIQFCRYALLVEQMGAKVILEVQKPLVEILKTMSPGITIAAEGETLPLVDCYCAQLSLPHIFNTTLDTVPAPIPYIFSHPEKAAYWKQKLGAKHKPRIGLVWSGGFHMDRPETWAWNKRRNLNLEHLQYFKGLPFDFISLQKGDPAESALRQAQESGWDGPHIINHTNELHDFSDTAALIENLDLVISVDTSTAHLAGAMGKPVWLLNRFDCCWRWLEQSPHSPWYPNMTIFNQARPGDWDAVMAQVVNALNYLHNNDSLVQEETTSCEM